MMLHESHAIQGITQDIVSVISAVFPAKFPDHAPFRLSLLVVRNVELLKRALDTRLQRPASTLLPSENVRVRHAFGLFFELIP
jgi:hypothetical protein